jgi:competence protein ComEC
MLAVGMILLAARRSSHLWQAWLVAMATVLLLDPSAILGAGFWMSFAAVAVLLLLFANRAGSETSWWRALLRAQLCITLFMLPLGAWWFQSVSISGLAANLLAVPWVSFIMVPLILLGLLLMLCSTSLSMLAFQFAAASSEYLLLALEWLAAFPASAIALPQPSFWALAVASVGGLMLLLPRGLPHRWLGLGLLLPLLLPAPRPAPGSLRMDVLDVGQGTAVLLGSARHLLVYDSGPGDGAEFNLVDQVLVPAMLQAGYRSPDRIIISHGDMDHAGGLHRLRELFPQAQLHANLGEDPREQARCTQGLEWAWDDVRFRVLHPSPYLPYLRNDSSCVVSVTFGRSSLLLPGDISFAIEERLVRQDVGPHLVLLAPHHGSKSSSGTEFLDQLQSRVAVATTGLGNRFGFPRHEVRQRYRDLGIALWSTDACGAIRVELAADGSLRAQTARRARPAPWRWPPAEFCP